LVSCGCKKWAWLHGGCRLLQKVMYHWVVLAARWWTKMSDSRDEEPRSLASCVWREDVALALDGCQSFWSYGVLHTMFGLHLLDSNWRQQPLEWVLQQRWQE
jgi:hypothetical protein